MNTKEFDIDDIVRSVLADVSIDVSADSQILAPEHDAEHKPEPAAISLRVISLEDVRRMNIIGRQIFVTKKSLLTPSAKDELRKRNIEIVRSDPAVNPNTADASPAVLGWCGIFPADAVSETVKVKIAKLLNRQGETFGTLSEMLFQAEKHAEKQAGLVTAAITSAPASVMYAACRSAVLRPVFGLDYRQITEDAVELQANMLILPSKPVFTAQKIELLKTFVLRRL